VARGKAANLRMRDESRERILAAGLGLFAAKGPAATRMAEIAAAAGVSQGLLYHYFRSKEELHGALIRGAFAAMNGAARALEALPLSPREKVVRALTELTRGLERDERAAQYFLLLAQATSSSATPPESQAVIEAERGEVYEVMTRILRAGQEDGSVRAGDPEELALTFWILVKGLALHRAALGSAFRAPDPALLAAVFLR
jgi:AcrR family transcriptional regulator